MKPMPTLIIKAERPCTVMIGGGASLLEKGESLILPCAADSETFFTVWGMNDPGSASGTYVPVLHRAAFSEGRLIASTAPALDWGEAAEVSVSPLSVRTPVTDEPKLMAQTDFVYRGRRARVELVSDGGAKLIILPDGSEPLSLPLGAGESGSLGVVDVGSAGILHVMLRTESGERLAALSQDGAVLLDVSGDSVKLDDGFPTVVDRLGTVRGHEKRTRYEFIRGAFRTRSEEIGFFGRPEEEPTNCTETALALAEELRLGVYDPEKYGFGGALDGGADESVLRDFFGPYSGEAPYPFALPEDKAEIGLISGDGPIRRPRRFLFTFGNGSIVDIDEV